MLHPYRGPTCLMWVSWMAQSPGSRGDPQGPGQSCQFWPIPSQCPAPSQVMAATSMPERRLGVTTQDPSPAKTSCRLVCPPDLEQRLPTGSPQESQATCPVARTALPLPCSHTRLTDSTG